MTIASEITRLQDVRTDIYDELGNKCVNLDGSSKYADVAPIIKKMPVVCAKIGANKYPVVKIGNQLWTAKNLDEDLGTLSVNEWYYNGRTEKTNLMRHQSWSGSINSSTQMYRHFYDGVKDWISNSNLTLRISFHIKLSQLVDGARNKIFIRNSADPYQDLCNVSISSLEEDVSVTTNGVNFEIKRSILFDLRAMTISGTEINCTISDLRVNVGTTDCGVNAIDFTTALANEATYKKYGRLYTWDNVNTNLASLGLQGWHLATQGDYENLVAIDSSGKKFRSKTFSNGTDDFGLNLLASGTKIADGNFNSIGTEFLGWCDNKKRYRNYSEGTNVAGPANTSTGFSVRLVCDLNEDGSIPDGAVIIAEADESAVATLADDEPSTDSEG